MIHNESPRRIRESPRRMTRGLRAKRAFPRVFKKSTKPRMSNYLVFSGKMFFFPLLTTRGHARFARSPLVVRLGDSRISLGDFSEIYLTLTHSK